MANQQVHDFWEHFVDRYGNSIKESRPELMIVGAISGNKYQMYERGNSLDANSEQLLRLSQSSIEVGDRVAVQTMQDGGRYVLGRLLELTDFDPQIEYNTFVHFPASSTSSTVAYSGKISESVTLPAGVWTVDLIAYGSGTHSAGGTMDLRTSVGNTSLDTSRTMVATATTRTMFGARQQKTGVLGGDPWFAQVGFKANTAGTVTLYDTVLFYIAKRTG